MSLAKGVSVLEGASSDRRQLADLVLASRVESALLGDPSLWVSGLRMEAHHGRVRIQGEVFAEDDREAVEHIRRRVDGVHMLESDLRIQPPPPSGM